MTVTSSPARAMALAATGFGLFAVMDVQIKWLARTIEVPQLLTTNATFALISVLVITVMTGKLRSLIRTRRPLVHLARGLTGVGSAFCGFYAIGLLPLATFYTLIFTAPLFITALSMILLHEPVGVRRWGAVLAGFVGVMIALRPGEGFGPGVLAALGNAVSFAAGMLIVRRFGASESSSAFAVSANLVAIVAGLLLCAGEVSFPDRLTLVVSITAGLTGGCAIMCVVTAFRWAAGAVVAPFQYTQLVWGSCFGWLFFAETPEWPVLVGSALIMASGLYIFRHESRRPAVAAGRRSACDSEASPDPR